MRVKTSFFLDKHNIFWHEWQLNPRSTAYNRALIFDIRGSLVIPRFLDAVSSLINSHDIFKLYFSEENDQVKINLSSVENECIEYVDISDQVNITQIVDEQIYQTRNYVFDLKKGPLYKASLIKIANHHYILALCFHHIIVDGISEKLIIDYISNYYNQQNTLKSALSLNVYASFKRELDIACNNNEASRFWQKVCKSIVSNANDLTPIQTHSNLERGIGEFISFKFDDLLVEKVKKIIHKKSSSWFCFLMTAYLITLHRLTDSEQLVICYAVDTRDTKANNKIGCFTNVLPLPVTLNGNMSFSSLLNHVTRLREKQKPHQAYPFIEIASKLRKLHKSDFDSLLNIALIQSHVKTTGLTLKDIDVHSLPEKENIPIYDLSLEYEFVDKGLDLRINYRSKSLDKDFIEHFPKYFRKIVELFVSAPETQIDEFSLLEDKEEKKILTQWNHTSTTIPTDMMLPQLITEQTAKTPEKSAIIFGNQLLSYQELEARSSLLAHQLHKNRCKQKNFIVPLILERGIDRIIAMVAVLKAGLAYTPIDPDYPVDRIGAILKDCKPLQVILSDQHLDKINRAISSSDLKQVKKVVVNRNIKKITSTDNLLPNILPTDLAYVIYTSGSTGQPKGVKVSHLSLLNFLFAMKKILKVQTGDNFINITPYSFDISALEIYLPLLLGSYCVVPTEETLKSGKQLAEIVDRNDIRFVQTTPTNWQLYLDTGWKTNHKITILSGGENLPKPLAKALLVQAKEVWNMYGPTETTVWSTSYCVTPKDINKYNDIPIGKPIDNTHTYVLDKYLQPVPVGRSGDLYISGLGLAEGYFGKPALTKKCFLNMPVYLLSRNFESPIVFPNAYRTVMYKTGDWVRWLSDGNLVFLGRKDQQIKHHGHRIELGEIEATLLNYTNIKQAIVLNTQINNEEGQKHYLVAFYTLKNVKKPIFEKDLRHYFAECLPNYCIPHQFILMTELPNNLNGKIDKKKLQLKAFSSNQYYTPILSKTENAICKIWREQLKVSCVSNKDNFYELGGDSLSAIRIAYLLEEQFMLGCSAQAVFNHPTVTDLAAYIDSHTKKDKSIHFKKLERTLPLPASSAQKRFWFLSQTYPAIQASYNIISAWRIKGVINIPALTKSVCLAIQRHEILRTTYSFTKGKLTQCITNAYTIHLQAELILESQLIEVIAREETYDFNFTKQPPYRIRLLETENSLAILLFNFHHIVADNHSLYVLMREISIFYNAFVLGRDTLHLPDLELQYADFSCWEARQMSKKAFKPSLDYWQERLKSYQELDLPSLKDSPSYYASQVENSFHFSIIGKDFVKIKEFCKNKKVTLFTLLLSVYYVLLSRYSRQTDIIVGTAIDQRISSVFENVLGCFVNTLPLRVDLSRNCTFEEFVKQVQENNVADFNHQLIPFDYLVEQLRIKRVEQELPLVKTMFSLTSECELSTLELTNLAVESMPVQITQSKFNLSLHFYEKQLTLNGVIEYRSDRYDDANIRRMSQHFLKLLLSFIDDPQQNIKNVSLLTALESKKITINWNQTAVDYPKEKTVHELLEEQVAKTPNAIAIVDQQCNITYLELHSRASKLASLLLDNNIGTHSLVPIVADRSIELIIGQFAVLKAGAAFIPLSPKTPSERLRFILEETKAHIWLTKEKFHNSLQDSIGLKNTGISTNLLCIDSLGLSLYKDVVHLNKVNSDHLAYAIYTSGSTGKPKLVAVKHKSLVNLICWHIKEYAVSHNDRASVVSGESFDALIWDIFPYLAAGACLYIATPDKFLDCHSWYTWVTEQKITLAFLPTPLVNQFLTTNKEFPANKLRFLLTGGDQLSTFSEKKYPFKIVNHYGLTETCIVATKFDVYPQRSRYYSRVPIGKPISNYKTYILDEYLNPVPINIPGELYVGGVGIDTCYLNNTLLNQQKYIRNPFNDSAKLFRTGDLACWLEDGNIKYIGRLDNQVKIRGYRIELGEVESTLLAYPQIEEAVVILKTDNAISNYLVAYIRTKQSITIPNSLIIDFLRQKLPDYMFPRYFFVVETYPMTINGKIDREALERLNINTNSQIKQKSHIRIGKDTTYIVVEKIFKELLGINSINPNANFFDFGVHSLMLVNLVEKITKKVKVNLYINDFFENTTLSQLNAVIKERLSHSLIGKNELTNNYQAKTIRHINNVNEIAVIAIACQFPGAKDPEEFWRLLCQGDETITRFTDSQLKEAGVTESLLNNPRYVKARGIIEDADCFDAGFFNITPREAVMMDPQQRLFLEQAWIALETAGYSPQKYHGNISVFAGCDESHYLEHILKGNVDGLAEVNDFQNTIANVTHAFLSTKVSYKLGLTGPSLNINTACSTGLVVVDTACQYLRNNRCDLALAGAISIKQPQIRGYLYQPDSILSADGHCRAFDKNASGTVPSAGCGIVVLKRLEDAIKDRDPILAIIKSTAINNDGTQKAGFTAPSIFGQINCINQALQLAKVSPESIGYIETHGTGTALGDPIEVKALTKVFAKTNKARNSCSIGSVKTNIGHADAAAGMAGLIKTILMLKNQKIPASLHFQQSNSDITFKETIFSVNTTLKNWRKPADHPRRAGVSAFGIGGTNAHLILEESPERKASNSELMRKHQIVILSAKTTKALNILKKELCHYLNELKSKKSHIKNTILADTAFTLQVGRNDFTERFAMVCGNVDEGVIKLESSVGYTSSSDANYINDHKPKVIFLFPGQGAQYVNMGRTLYESEAIFRQVVDTCCDLFKPYLNIDLRSFLFSDLEYKTSASQLLKQTQLVQPALFCIEYALVKLYNTWGVYPEALIGDSLGELTAACVAGVFSLEDAVKIVYLRGKLLNRLDIGAMLLIQAPSEEILPFIADTLSIASINTESTCTVSGSYYAINELKNSLIKKSIRFQPIMTSHALHSAIVDEIIPEYVAEIQKIELKLPEISIISNLTGKWATAEQLIDPHYWGQQLRQTVQFFEGIKTIYETIDNPLFLECGPGSTLTNWVKQHTEHERHHKTIFSISSAKNYEESPEKESQIIHNALASLWSFGVTIDWLAYHKNIPRRRIALPSYPFEKKRYWPMISKTIKNPLDSLKPDLSECFYQPSWNRQSSLNGYSDNDGIQTDNKYWIIFALNNSLCNTILEQLKLSKSRVICVYEGVTFEKLDQYNYIINSHDYENYLKLFQIIANDLDEECQIIHLWGLNKKVNNADTIYESLYAELYSMTYIAQAATTINIKKTFNIFLVNDFLQSVFENEVSCPIKSTTLGACQTIPLEYPNIKISSLDITDERLDYSDEKLANNIIIDALQVSSQSEVQQLAYRNGYRWEKTFQALKLHNKTVFASQDLFRNKGVYLITGGLGGIGLSLAAYLTRTTLAHIALVSRTSVPPIEEWEKWLLNNTDVHPQYAIIKELASLKATGAFISVWSADVGCYENMRKIVSSIEESVGNISGIFHAAGVPSSSLIQKTNIDDISSVLQSKLFGTYVLSKLFKNKRLDFVLLFSSLTSLTGGIGQLAYSAANAALDAFPSTDCFHEDTLVAAINWNAWQQVGMFVEANKTANSSVRYLQEINDNNSITPEQGIAALTVCLNKRLKNLAVSQILINDVIKNVSNNSLLSLIKKDNEPTKGKIKNKENTFHEQFISLFQEVLGIEKIDLNDDFFALGGDSLAALTLVEKIEKINNIHLSLDSIYHNRTPLQIAKYIQQPPDKISKSPIVLLNSVGATPPLFFIHPVGGTIFCYIPLAKQLEERRKLYAIQDPGLSQPNYTFNSLEAMASYYLTEIQKIQPQGPYYIGGYSLGGTIAFEIARQLLDQNEQINFLGLFDSWATFSTQFQDKQFFERKMQNQLKDMEQQLKSSIDSSIENWLNRQWERMQLLLTYNPKILDCKITLFKAQQLLPEYTKINDPYNHWQQYSTVPIDMFSASGDHDTILTIPNIHTLADNLLQYIDNSTYMEVYHV